MARVPISPMLSSFVAVCLTFPLALSSPVKAQWPPWLTEEERPIHYPPILVSAEWVTNRLGEESVVLVDARDHPRYRESHLPGAISIPPGTLDEGRAGEELGRRGLSGRETVVCYGDADAPPAAGLLFWLLELAGHPDVRVLDGGLEGWERSGGRLEIEERIRVPVAWSRPADPTRRADRAYLRDHFGRPRPGRPEHEILDARGAEVWATVLADPTVRPGHIPHSLPFDFRSLIRPDGSFAKPADMREILDGVGPRGATTVDLDSEFIVYDDGGSGDGALGYLTLRIAGVERVRYFRGGWAEWTADATLPVTRIVGFPEMHRALSGESAGRTVLFDVRHEPDFDAGHVPGAVLLPSHQFADSLETFLERHYPGIDRANAFLAVYCYGVDCIRSRNCATLAAQKGFRDIGWFRGGLSEWKRSAGDVERSVDARSLRLRLEK